MSSTSETGHAKNAANFDTLVTAATGFGQAYNPSIQSIQLPALQALSASAKMALHVLNNTLPGYSNAVAAREIAFAPLSKLTTRILNFLRATGAAEQVIDNAITIVRKIQGIRATPKKTEEEKAALAAEGKASKEISTSQMGYDNRLDNFDKLVQLLSSIPQYTPNEAELTVETLQAFYNELDTKNAAVISASIALDNARIARGEVMYKEKSGLVDVATAVK